MDETETINRYLHEKVLGLCWHEEMIAAQDNRGARLYGCTRCPARLIRGYIYGLTRGHNPNYCSSLDLMRPVEEEVVEVVGKKAYLIALAEVVGIRLAEHCEPYADATFYKNDLFTLAMATALQRGTACKKAMEAKQHEG